MLACCNTGVVIRKLSLWLAVYIDLRLALFHKILHIFVGGDLNIIPEKYVC